MESVIFSTSNREALDGVLTGISSMKFKKIQSKEGDWYIGEVPNKADNIYYADPTDKKGFGGRTIDFELDDGTVDSVTGIWHSNSRGLLASTGIDVIDTSYSFGIIALNRERVDKFGDSYKYTDILHLDKEPVLGAFDRIGKLAQEYANELQKPVCYAVIQLGGSSSGSESPKQ